MEVAMDGSIRPRRRRIERGIYEEPNGKYAVCIMVAAKPRFRTIDARTLTEARRQRALLQTLGELGELPLSPSLTFGAIAARWLADFEDKVAIGTRSERTLDLYRSQLRLHLLPQLSRRRIAAITADDVVAVTRQLFARGLSPWSVKRILGALSCVFSYSLRRGYISQHPFACLERDERPHPIGSDQRVLTRSELVRLFAACPRRDRPFLFTGAFTGMRLSELLALGWEDVDFPGGVIRVRHQLARGRLGVPPRRIPPKTRASVREIPLLPQLAVVLREHKRGSRFTEGSDYVFATARGTPFLHHNVSRRVLRRAAVGRSRSRRPAGPVPRPAPHLCQPSDHRHSPRRRPGEPHPRPARTSMTLDTYTHLFETARHGTDVRAELAKSDFANLLTHGLAPRLRAGEHLRSARAAHPKRLPTAARKRRHCAPVAGAAS
jgi:integrase